MEQDPLVSSDCPMVYGTMSLVCLCHIQSPITISLRFLFYLFSLNRLLPHLDFEGLRLAPPHKLNILQLLPLFSFNRHHDQKAPFNCPSRMMAYTINSVHCCNMRVSSCLGKSLYLAKMTQPATDASDTPEIVDTSVFPVAAVD